MKEFLRLRSDVYVTIPNTFLRDGKLSYKAKGLLAMIMALPDNWDFSVRGMLAISKDGEAALRAAINELKERGYCIVEPYREGGKIAKWVYYFSGDVIRKEDVTGEAEEEKPSEPKEKPVAKKDIDLPFSDFYDMYPLKKSKKGAEKAWARLSRKDREEAMAKLPEYIQDCQREHRNIQHPSTYLNQRTWEDCFTQSATMRYYDVLPTDNAQEAKFKNYIRTNFPAIEQAASPLTLKGYMAAFQRFGRDAVSEVLDTINVEIWKYRRDNIDVVLEKILREEND